MCNNAQNKKYSLYLLSLIMFNSIFFYLQKHLITESQRKLKKTVEKPVVLPVKDWKTSPRGSPKLKRKSKKDEG